jgi:hypothetical protein
MQAPTEENNGLKERSGIIPPQTNVAEDRNNSVIEKSGIIPPQKPDIKEKSGIIPPQ